MEAAYTGKNHPQTTRESSIGSLIDLIGKPSALIMFRSSS